MNAACPGRSSEERRNRARLAAACVLALTTSVGCTGENLFGLGVVGTGGGGTEPQVEITAPAANAVLNAGDSVQVEASITSDNGVNQVTVSGVFDGGGTAFVQQVLTMSVTTDTTISQFVQPAGVTTGAASIIVEARDVLGNTGSDTVAVGIN